MAKIRKKSVTISTIVKILEEIKMAQCDECTYYIYDEDYEEYICDASMDEDDYGRLLSGHYKSCPYFKNGDEYEVVRHQI